MSLHDTKGFALKEKLPDTHLPVAAAVPHPACVLPEGFCPLKSQHTKVSTQRTKDTWFCPLFFFFYVRVYLRECFRTCLFFLIAA